MFSYLETTDVNGGIIAKNQAKGSFTGETARYADKGVGGGIYLLEGTFKMAGSNVGLHSNQADVAANDAFATGGSTTLELPDVKNMNLTGYVGDKPTGWFADYQAPDSNYPQSVINAGRENPGRYDYYKGTNNVEVTHTVLSGNKTTFYCLTLGLPYPGYGSLEITKTLNTPVKETQTFVFSITGHTLNNADYSLQVTITIPKGQTEAKVSIPHLPDGTYTITEEDWSWRYDQTNKSIWAKDSAPISGSTFDLNSHASEWFAKYTNELEEDKWVSGEVSCRNWWGKFWQNADKN